MRILLIILSLFSLLRPATPPTLYDPADVIAYDPNEKPIKRVITSGSEHSTGANLKVSFLEYKRASYPGGKKQPLIIFLHGQGERGTPGDTTTSNGIVKVYNTRIPSMIRFNDLPYFAIPGTSDTATYIVLAPQCSTSFGTWPTMYVEEMLKYADTNLADVVDFDRIYLVGLSQGGGGVWSALRVSAIAKRIAGAVAICPGYWPSGDPLPVVAKNGVPFWVFHAANDPTATVANPDGYLTSLNQQVPLAAIQYIRFSGATPGSSGHSIWNIILDLEYGVYALSNGSVWNENETGRMWDFLLRYMNNNQRKPIVWTYPKPYSAPVVRMDFTNPLNIAS